MMLLDILFNRNSKLVMAFEAAGLMILVAVFAIGRFSQMGHVTKLFFFLFLLGYLLTRACAMWKFYVSGGPGITTHFKKMQVANSYILFFTSLLIILNIVIAPICLAMALFAFILYVNGTLIYLHLKDGNDTPPNFLTNKSAL